MTLETLQLQTVFLLGSTLLNAQLTVAMTMPYGKESYSKNKLTAFILALDSMTWKNKF